MRTRTRSLAGPSGHVQRVDGVKIDSFESVISRSSVTDGFGVRNGVFDVHHLYTENAAASWSAPQGWTGGVYYNGRKGVSWIPGALRQPLSIAHLNDASLPDLPSLATLTLGRTNPSRAKIDLPVSLLELRELPDLLRKAGQSFFAPLASANIKWQFGVKPLIGDFISLLEIKRSADNRMKLFKKLQEKPLLRKVALYENVIEAPQPWKAETLSSANDMLVNYHVRSWRTSYKVWGYVTWTPSTKLLESPMDDAALLTLAKRTVLGLTIDGSTVWEALPWSWLADWYSNFGDWLAANRSLIDVVPSTPRICFTLETRKSYANRRTNSIPEGVSTPTVVHTQKARRIVSAAWPTASLPFLTDRQVGILASLAVLKGRR